MEKTFIILQQSTRLSLSIAGVAFITFCLSMGTMISGLKGEPFYQPTTLVWIAISATLLLSIAVLVIVYAALDSED